MKLPFVWRFWRYASLFALNDNGVAWGHGWEARP